MNKRAINKAANLFLLANTAHLDVGGTDTDEQTDVVVQAIAIARSKLAKMGIAWESLLTLQSCIDYVKQQDQGVQIND